MKSDSRLARVDGTDMTPFVMSANDAAHIAKNAMVAPPGKRNSKPACGEKAVRIDLEGIDPGRRKVIDDMLREGATFEDVVDTLNAQPGEAVTQLAVESYFRANFELQKQRVRRMVEKMEALKQAIGDPETAEGQLAEATLFTGLMGLTRKSTEIDARDAQTFRLKNENLKLERALMEMKKKDALLERHFLRARTKHEYAKFERVRADLKEIKSTLTTLKRGEPLDRVPGASSG